jgi:predicted Zn-dependent peptidase
MTSALLLSYYVRKCQKPKDRVAIGLAVKIGSVAEEDSEQGVAHILEHLAFNATDVGVM